MNQPSSAADSSQVLPGHGELLDYARSRYGDFHGQGWRVRTRSRFGYVTPENTYKAVVGRFVTQGCAWLDVGGGKTMFPGDDELAESLAQRCEVVAAVDPSDNVKQNPFAQIRAQCFIEEFTSPRLFDLATMRMVAEHIQAPAAAVNSLSRLVKSGGIVIVYTPNRWSVTSVLAALSPHRIHQLATRFSWNTQDEDVFPTVYRMNTRRSLRAVFENGGFREIAFARLDHCCLTQRWRPLYFLELSGWRLLSAAGIRYPESNLLGIYRRV